MDGATFTSNLDCMHFAHGLALVLLAMACLDMPKANPGYLKWRWLLCFSLVLGAGEWLDMISFNSGNFESFASPRCMVTTVAFIALAGFCRNLLANGGKRIPGVALILLLMVFVPLPLLVGSEKAEVLIRCLLVLPVGIASALLLYRRGAVNSLKVAAAALAAYVGLTGAFPLLADAYPAAGELASGGELAAHSALIGLALAVAVPVYRYRFNLVRLSFPEAAAESFWRSRLVLPAILAALTLAGWFIVEYAGNQADSELRASLLSRASTGGASLDPKAVAALGGKDSDIGTPAYEGLKAQLTRIRHANQDCRFAYLFGLQGDKVVFLVDSETTGSEDYSPPGEVYQEASAELKSIFASGKAVTEGPLPDQWGVWVSALLPIKGEGNGPVLAVFGMDMDASRWFSNMMIERLDVLLVLIPLSLLLLTFFAAQRHKVEVAYILQAAERRLRNVFDHVNDAIIVQDAQGRIIEANGRMLSLFGLSKAELPGLSFNRDLSSQGAAVERLSALQQQAMSGQKQLFEWLMRKPNSGEEFMAEVYFCRMELAEQQVLVATIRDISEQKRLQAGLVQAEQLAAVGMLAGGIAHEFNNMNQPILGNVDLLLLRSQLGDRERSQLEMIKQGIERSSSMIKKLQTFSGRQSSKKQKASLRDAVESVIALISDSFSAEGVSVRTDFGPVPEFVFCRAQIEQVILNLIMNARHALLGQETKEIIVSLGQADGRAFLRIRDTGCGISAEDKTKLFLPFFSTKGEHAAPGNNPQAEIKGSGLGLSVSLLLIKEHGGEMKAESELGKGSCFTVYLPISTGE